MTEMQHFPKISYVSGCVTVNIDLTQLGERTSKAQRWLGDRALEDCKAVMPLQSGNLQQRSYASEDGKKVIFPGPYARFLYGGKVMLDPDTGSPWARKGVKKVLTDRPLQYSRPGATDHWFDTAKARNGAYWVDGAERIIRGEKDVE